MAAKKRVTGKKKKNAAPKTKGGRIVASKVKPKTSKKSVKRSAKRVSHRTKLLKAENKALREELKALRIFKQHQELIEKNRILQTYEFQRIIDRRPRIGSKVPKTIRENQGNLEVLGTFRLNGRKAKQFSSVRHGEWYEVILTDLARDGKGDYTGDSFHNVARMWASRLDVDVREIYTLWHSP